MFDLNFTLFQILLILALYIFIFFYSAISADMMTTCICLMIFMIFLLPFYILIEKLKLIIFINDIGNILFFKILIFYSTIIVIFIGFFLFIQLIYLLLSG